MAKLPAIAVKEDKDLYLALLRAIVGQQLSVKAADTIWQRFLALFRTKYPHPKLLLKTGIEKLRSAGLSYQKAGYLRNIAEFSLLHSFDYEYLEQFDDEALISYLVQIKGVGRWTAEMVLMFHLGRTDIFPKDDLGIQMGMRQFYKLRELDKKKFLARIEKIASAWRPYRTLACMYIWKARDTAALKKKPGS